MPDITGHQMTILMVATMACCNIYSNKTVPANSYQPNSSY